MAEGVQIKQFEPGDEGAVLRFLRTVAYPGEPRKSDPAYWRWHYLETPGTAPDDVPLWLVKSGGEVLGQAAHIPVDLKVGDARSRAVWLLDFVVAEQLRGKGLGKLLAQAALSRYPVVMTLGFNEQSGRVFRSLKWAALGGVRRYQRLLFPGDALAEVARFGPLRAALNLLYAPARAGIGKAREVAEFDDSFDALWRDASRQWPCAVERTSAFLSWQFRRQPGKRFDVLGYYDGGGRLRGYAVLFFRKAGPGGAPPKAAISDLCYGRSRAEEVIDGLLGAALRLAVERRAGSLVTDVHDLRTEEALGRHGFRLIKRSPQFMATTTEELGRTAYDPANWFLTRADSDVSIFEEPNL
jgi:GNAT superfamily N-acetyltransferase